MKSTGIVRKVDQLNRIVIPIEICRTRGIKNETPMEVYVEDDAIILKKYNPGCSICGSMENLAQVNGKNICKECAAAALGK